MGFSSADTIGFNFSMGEEEEFTRYWNGENEDLYVNNDYRGKYEN